MARLTDLGSGFRQVLDAERPLVPADVYEIGSMLSYDERVLLHWAARTALPGAIVDLGSFLGGSTLALAQGVGARGAVHAFDLFTCRGEAANTWAPEGSNLAPGDSLRPLFERNIAPVGDRVVVHEGDIRDARWRGPISVLFVDIAKGWTSGDAVWRTFLPWVRPGGLVIQQDLVHWGHPWCTIVMDRLREDFEYLGWVWTSSAVYRCRRTPTAVPAPLLDHVDCEEMLASLDRTAQRVGHPAAGSIQLSGAFVFAAHGRIAEARERVETVRSDYDDAVVPYIEQGFAYLDRWLDDVEAGRTSALADIEVPRTTASRRAWAAVRAAGKRLVHRVTG